MAVTLIRTYQDARREAKARGWDVARLGRGYSLVLRNRVRLARDETTLHALWPEPPDWARAAALRAFRRGETVAVALSDSTAERYLVTAIRCSCPDRAWPCKHAFGRYLLLANARDVDALWRTPLPHNVLIREGPHV